MPRPRLVLIGQKFGRLTVLSEAGAVKNGRTGLSAWRVVCDCGVKKKVAGSHLVTGRIKSCGCGRGGRPVPVEVPEGHGYCWQCRLVKLAKFFYRNHQTKTGLNTRCIECYRKRTPRQQVQLRKKRRERVRRLREEAIAHYGGKCICCGEKAFEFLAVRAHRRVFCHNCYTAKREFRYCPHEEKIVVG
jgi:hypothetical protein